MSKAVLTFLWCAIELLKFRQANQGRLFMWGIKTITINKSIITDCMR